MGQSPCPALPTHTLQIPLDFILMFPIQSLTLMTMIFLWPFLCYICMLRILVLKDRGTIRLGNPRLSNCFTLTCMTKMQTKNTTTNRNSWESVSHLHFLHMMSAFSLHFKFMHYVHSYIDSIHYERYKE